MTKTHILAEIERTAEANGGLPLGRARFEAETGIKEADWFGRYWARWSDAVREAGLTPNEYNTAYDDDVLLEKYANLAKELERLPVAGDLRLKARSDKEFPSHSTFNRLGQKQEVIRRLAIYCRSHEGYEDVGRLCEGYLPPEVSEVDQPLAPEEKLGFVYLMRSGRYYKIGMSNSVGRREYELGLQLPDPVSVVHAIRTDDPPGIEEYWHKRFAAKRKNGEWFELNAADIAVFKRRKFM